MLEKRLGESDKDYEARKKRVARQRMCGNDRVHKMMGGGGIGGELKPVGNNLYPNYNLAGGSSIVQDIPEGDLPTSHNLAFDGDNPCDALYITLDDIEYLYSFNTNQEPARLVLQQIIGYGVFEVGKRYRFQANVKTVTDTPVGGDELRALHIAATTELTLVDSDNAMIGENEDKLCWIDFEVTDTATGRGNFRHGCGVWEIRSTLQDTSSIAIYELSRYNKVTVVDSNGDTAVDANNEEGKA